MPPEWEACLLSILPKKGDLRLPGNYRGIMMLEVGYKIVSIVLNARLQPVAESLDGVMTKELHRMRLRRNLQSCEDTL